MNNLLTCIDDYLKVLLQYRRKYRWIHCCNFIVLILNTLLAYILFITDNFGYAVFNAIMTIVCLNTMCGITRSLTKINKDILATRHHMDLLESIRGISLHTTVERDIEGIRPD